MLKTGVELFQLSGEYSKYLKGLGYDEASRNFMLHVNTEIVPMCRECRKEIEVLKGEKLYFCPDKKMFFHRDCLLKSKHQILCYDEWKEHQDHPVILMEPDEKENVQK